MRNKKTLITITSIVAVLLVIVGVTYAYWLVTKNQTNSNVLGAGCLDISLSGEKNDIELTEQFPLSDTDGMKLVPYEFTVTNNCNTSVDYQVNLESIGEESTSIIPEALKVALGDKIGLLSSKKTTDPTLSDAYESRILGMSRLAARGETGSSDTYELRIWIDENAPISEQNKTFESKISVSVGQFILSKYEEGTLAYDILSNYGGTGVANTIDTAGYEVVSAERDMWVSKTAKYWYGTSYTLDKETGMFTLSGNLVQSTVADCRSGVNTCGEYTLRNSSNEYGTKVLYKITSFTNSDKSDTTYDTYVKEKYISFKNIYSSNADIEPGIYKTKDNSSDTYYFSGNVTNNYVKLGTWNETLVDYISAEWSSYGDDEGFFSMAFSNYMQGLVTTYSSMEECENAVDLSYNKCYKIKRAEAGEAMYWRIVRINGDGTIRLVYDGIKTHNDEKVLMNTIGKTAYFANAYSVCYNEETTTWSAECLNYSTSDLKSFVDDWYVTNFASNESLLADSSFCNDTSGSKYDSLLNGWRPSLLCNDSDILTVANGRLTHPVGVLSADESLLTEKYLTNPSYSLTMTICDKGVDWSKPTVFSGSIRSSDPYIPIDMNRFSEGSAEVQPVINIKADVKFTGDGTIENPYILSID